MTEKDENIMNEGTAEETQEQEEPKTLVYCSHLFRLRKQSKEQS